MFGEYKHMKFFDLLHALSENVKLKYLKRAELILLKFKELS